MENLIRGRKGHKLFEWPYDRGPDRLQRELEVAGGIANMPPAVARDGQIRPGERIQALIPDHVRVFLWRGCQHRCGQPRRIARRSHGVLVPHALCSDATGYGSDSHGEAFYDPSAAQLQSITHNVYGLFCGPLKAKL